MNYLFRTFEDVFHCLIIKDLCCSDSDQLVYFITEPFVCQELFLIYFLKLFRTSLLFSRSATRLFYQTRLLLSRTFFRFFNLFCPFRRPGGPLPILLAASAGDSLNLALLFRSVKNFIQEFFRQFSFSHSELIFGSTSAAGR